MINLFIIDIFSMQLHDCSAKKAFCYVFCYVVLLYFRICTCAACSHRRPGCSCVCYLVLLFNKKAFYRTCPHHLSSITPA